MNRVVIVFGSSGLLGASLVPHLRSLGYQVAAQGRGLNSDLCLDPLSIQDIVLALKAYRPHVLINLIAETNVDRCEDNPQLAFWANAGFIQRLLDGIRAFSQEFGWCPHLLHLSTDQIYDGKGPHKECQANPINVYALSKYTGELIAMNTACTILRTNFFGKSKTAVRDSFTDWLMKKLKGNENFTVFDDVKFSALHIDTLCKVIVHCIEHRPLGIFNVGSRSALSKAEFAQSLAQLMDLPVDCLSVGSSEGALLRAKRPVDMSLDVSRFEKSTGFELPSIQSELIHAAKEYKHNEL